MRNGLILALLATFALSSQAALAKIQAAQAFGELHYEKKDQVATRNITLEMAKDEDGAPTWLLRSGDLNLQTTKGWIKEKRGGKIAYVAFKNAFNMGGKTSHLLLKGLKLKGDNKMVYSGTLYKTTEAALQASGETFEDCIEKVKEDGKLDEKWKISGAFKVQKEISQTTFFE